MRAAAFGVAAGAQAAQQFRFELNFDRRGRRRQRWRVGVDRHKTRARKIPAVQRVEHGDAGAAHAENFHRRSFGRFEHCRWSLSFGFHDESDL